MVKKKALKKEVICFSSQFIPTANSESERQSMADLMCQITKRRKGKVGTICELVEGELFLVFFF